MRWVLITLTFLLVACSERTAAPIVPDALLVGHQQKVFVGTTRAVDDNGTFGVARSSKLHLLEVDVSVPPNRAIGSISNGQDKPNPDIDFVIAKQTEFTSPKSFQNSLQSSLSKLPANEREATVFVHGYNNSFSDAIFRTAQLAEDLEYPSVSIAYAWPSRGHFLGYEYDNDSALFARDGLQNLLETIQASGAQRIAIVAHSLGSNLAMEAMRQIELAKPGWTDRHLSGVILFSPDINVDVFRSQINAFQKIPQPFIVFTSNTDRVLQVSAGLRLDKIRLGNLRNIEVFSDYPIQFIDVSAFTDGEHGNHFVAASSPSLLSLLNSVNRLGTQFLAGKTNAAPRIPGSHRRVMRNATQIVLTPDRE